MEIFGDLIGNEDIKNTLGNAILRNEFSHAYIIEGPDGSGKKTAVRLASASIICQNRDTLPCKKCNSCQKILNDSHVDVRFYDAHKVEDVRKIKEAIYQSATESDYQIFILNDAHKMTIQAQNALLLSLEEPPKNIVFFLLCKDANLLLETIRSRAQLLRTSPLSTEQMISYVERKLDTDLSSDELRKLAPLANGSLGAFIDMLDPIKSNSLIKAREQAEEFISGILNLDTGSANLIYSMYSWQRDKVKELFSLALCALRDLAMVKKAKNVPLCFYTSYDEARQNSSRYSIKKILKLIDAINMSVDSFGVNASVAGVLASILTYCK